MILLVLVVLGLYLERRNKINKSWGDVFAFSNKKIEEGKDVVTTHQCFVHGGVKG